MTQRNPLNDRNLAEKTGQTRKSAASAKPKSARAATVREPAPKSAKQKKAEARAREERRHKRSMVLDIRFEDTPQYKHLRHWWWGFLLVAVVCTVFAAVLSTQTSAFFAESPDGLFLGVLPQSAVNVLNVVLMIAAYGGIIAAFYVDLSKIRKARRAFENMMVTSNSKAMRKSQKQHRAQLREQERAKQEAKAAAGENGADTPNNQPTSTKGFFGRFTRKPQTTKRSEAPDEGNNATNDGENDGQ